MRRATTALLGAVTVAAAPGGVRDRERRRGDADTASASTTQQPATQSPTTQSPTAERPHKRAPRQSPTTDSPTSDPTTSRDDEPHGGPTDGRSGRSRRTRRAQFAESSGEWDLVLTDVRVGEHEGFDRIVLEFTGTGVPGWSVGWVDRARLDGSGEAVDLDGDAVLDIYASGTTWPADGYYDGPSGSSPDGGEVDDVYVGGTFEGYTQVLAGIDGDPPRSGCSRSPTLPASWWTSPTAPTDGRRAAQDTRSPYVAASAAAASSRPEGRSGSGRWAGSSLPRP